MPLTGIGRTVELHNRYPERGGDVGQAGVDADAQVHPRKQSGRLAERECGGVVVHVGGHCRPDERQDRGMGTGVAKAAAEKDLAAAVVDETGHHAGHPPQRPAPVDVGRLGGDEHPRTARGDAAQQAFHPLHRGLHQPIFVAAVVDLDAVAAQQVEEQLDLVSPRPDRDAAGEQRRPLPRGEADPVRNAGQPDEQHARKRPLEDVGPIVAPAPQPAGGGDDVGHRCEQAPADTLRPPPGEEFVLVGTIGQNVPRARLDEHVDHGVGKSPPQVPQEGNRQHRVADEPVADDEHPPRTVVCGHVRHGGRR